MLDRKEERSDDWCDPRRRRYGVTRYQVIWGAAGASINTETWVGETEWIEIKTVTEDYKAMMTNGCWIGD